MNKKASLLFLGLAGILTLASCGKKANTDTATTNSTTDVETTGDATDTSTTQIQREQGEEVEGNMFTESTFSKDEYELSIGNNYVGVGPWGYYGLDGGKGTAYVTPKGELCIDIERYTKHDYCIQVGHKSLEIGQDSEYHIKFDIYAEKPQHGKVLIQKDGSPYTAYFEEDYDITTEKTTFEYDFTSNVTDERAAFVFNIGWYGEGSPETNKVYFDNISLVCTKDSGVFQKEIKNILVNQVGYLPNATKHAVIRSTFTDKTFTICDEEGNVVYTGDAAFTTKHIDTGEFLQVIDFTDFTTPGKYYIHMDKLGNSVSFEIKEGVYDELYAASYNMLYLQRCGYAVEDEVFGHDACHENYKTATIYGTTETIDVSGGWHDAGDYGKYVVAGVKAIEDLFISYENNGNAAVLTEAKYELDWMLKMQREDGKVYHKVTSYDFPAPDLLATADTTKMVVSDVSYAATADFAAIMARAAKFYAEDEATAAVYKTAALKAYAALADMPKISYKNPEDITTGEYPDSILYDELQYAAIALYDLTGEAAYLKVFEDNLNEAAPIAYGWDTMTAYAYRLYLKNKTAEKYETVLGLMQEKATEFKTNIDSCPYGDPIKILHEWGSNLTVCGAAMLMMDLDNITGEDSSAYITKILNYLLGVNSTTYSYVTGFGELSAKNPHHRPSIGLETAMPGMLVGGPNNDFVNNGGDAVANSKLNGNPQINNESAYIDDPGSFSTNEVTIYWNSPLVVLLSYFCK